MSKRTLEQLDARILELATLEPGWLDGDGESIKDWPLSMARKFVAALPNREYGIFPTHEGGISIEWRQDDADGHNNACDLEFQDNDKTVKFWSFWGSDPKANMFDFELKNGRIEHIVMLVEFEQKAGRA